MGKIAIMAIIALALAGCQTTPTDTFCLSHRQSDFAVSRPTIEAMTPAERRNALAVLEEGAARCGGRP